MRNFILSMLVCLISFPASAIDEETVIYKIGDQSYEGFIAKPKGRKLSPAVLIIHQWMGLTDYEKMRARMLAEEGYVAFAIDVYGKGVRPKNTTEASKKSSALKNDPQLLRTRIRAAHEFLLERGGFAKDRLAVMGYCFGGGAALEYARSGAKASGFVSFHGNLDSKAADDTKNIKGKVLVLHGAADPYVPNAEVAEFTERMNEAKVDWKMVSYGGAVHSFTQKAAGDDPSKGAAYDADADRDSWEQLEDFLQESL